ncbi:glycoside hydrolase superfamily [Earliella scabrosa]|nr:glycoside hydrolase superfamily [Earliella scabrosa]
MRFTIFSGVLAAAFVRRAIARMPEKVYGVNLGSWLLLEPWMLPQEWAAMGGENNCDCKVCIGSEFALAQAYPDTVDERFERHWSTWFNQTDIDKIVAAGINTVRIPLGYWIVEHLVDRKTEFYPRGGIFHLQRGLKALKKAGVAVILDHHALPGVQAESQQFAGRCTDLDGVKFYTPYNYQRALIWTAVMTALSHLDPDFEAVFSIQAVNEPIMDGSLTPGYGDFQKNYVQTIRAMEAVLRIGGPVLDLHLDIDLKLSLSNVTAAISTTVQASRLLNLEVKAALLASVSILLELSQKLKFKLNFTPPTSQQKELVANFMDVNWQWNNPDANPADAAIGPMAYDNHLYYSFGGVADDNELAYMIHICNLDRIERDAALGNTPLWFGEWALPTQFGATDEFLYKWADAQKFAYGKDKGWIFWNFKIEETSSKARQWSYFEGLKRGYLTQDPSKFNDPNVCEPYIGQIYTSTTPVPPSTSTEAITATETASVTTTDVSASTTTGAEPFQDASSSSDLVFVSISATPTTPSESALASSA